jgi:hypothetical protein
MRQSVTVVTSCRSALLDQWTHGAHTIRMMRAIFLHGMHVMRASRWPVALVLLGLVAFGLAIPGVRRGEPPFRTGTIILGVPRSHFVVLGADRLWTNALPHVDDSPAERQGLQLKIAAHDSLPLAVAVAGIASLGSEHDTVEHIRRLIAPLGAPRLDFDTVVELLRVDLLPQLQVIRAQAKRALARNPADAVAKIRLKTARLTLLVACVTGGRATLGTLQLDDRWTTKRVAPPRGVAAWPDALDAFYTQGPYRGMTAMYGASIQDPMKLAAHVRRVIEAGIQEDARRHASADRHVAGPVDVILIDAKGARCVSPCSPLDLRLPVATTPRRTG